MRESEPLLDEARQLVRKIFDRCSNENVREWTVYKTCVRDELSSFIFRKTRRTPMILPIIMEV